MTAPFPSGHQVGGSLYFALPPVMHWIVLAMERGGGKKMKTGSLRPLEDDSVLHAAPGVAFVLEVVGGFDSATHDNGKIIVGT